MVKLFTTAALMALAVSGGAIAQDREATLQVDAGTVMSSEGGDFVSAASGKALMEGQRVMVTEGSRATLVYENGCRDELLEPGVYEVDDENCTPAVLLSAGSTVFGVGTVPFLIVSAGVIAIILSGDDDDDRVLPPAPPVSP